jgi:hypothetical protein
MRILQILSIAAFSLVCSSPAFAWWDYAKWGMTPQQLTAASKGRMKERTAPTGCLSGRNGTPVPTHQVEGLEIVGLPATANFAFDAQNKLIRTEICFSDVHGPNPAYRVSQALIATYGMPAAKEGGSFPSWAWRDNTKGTSIKMTDFGRVIEVVYIPTSGTGL